MLAIFKIFKRKKNKLFLFFICLFFPIPNGLYSTENINQIYEKLEISNNNINWKKFKNSGNEENFNINWEKYDETDLINKDDDKLNNHINDVELNQNELYKLDKFTVSSFNRSLVFDNNKVGPDITFLVPLGFKSLDSTNLDMSIRGWNRRPKNSNLLAWNGGDAVGQVFYQFQHNDKSSFGLNLGIRSIYKGKLPGGTTGFGEGTSAGFRFDYKLGDLSGIAIGAEQFIQFDNKTDTGRDIYISISKAFIDNSVEKKFPIFIATGGIGTGYFALWDKTKFACSDLFDGAAVDIKKYHQLCWGPFGSVSLVLNNKISTFIEYNNYSFMTGIGIAPFKKVRLTAGLTLAESFDDYKFKNWEEMRFFGRISIGI